SSRSEQRQVARKPAVQNQQDSSRSEQRQVDAETAAGLIFEMYRRNPERIRMPSLLSINEALGIPKSNDLPRWKDIELFLNKYLESGDWESSLRERIEMGLKLHKDFAKGAAAYLIRLFQLEQDRTRFPSQGELAKDLDYRRKTVNQGFSDILKQLEAEMGRKNFDAELKARLEEAIRIWNEKQKSRRLDPEDYLDRIVDFIIRKFIDEPERKELPYQRDLAHEFSVNGEIIKRWKPDILELLASRIAAEDVEAQVRQRIQEAIRKASRRLGTRAGKPSHHLDISRAVDYILSFVQNEGHMPDFYQMAKALKVSHMSVRRYWSEIQFELEQRVLWTSQWIQLDKPLVLPSVTGASRFEITPEEIFSSAAQVNVNIHSPSLLVIKKAHLDRVKKDLRYAGGVWGIQGGEKVREVQPRQIFLKQGEAMLAVDLASNRVFEIKLSGIRSDIDNISLSYIEDPGQRWEYLDLTVEVLRELMSRPLRVSLYKGNIAELKGGLLGEYGDSLSYENGSILPNPEEVMVRLKQPAPSERAAGSLFSFSKLLHREVLPFYTFPFSRKHIQYDKKTGDYKLRLIRLRRSELRETPSQDEIQSLDEIEDIQPYRNSHNSILYRGRLKHDGARVIIKVAQHYHLTPAVPEEMVRREAAVFRDIRDHHSDIYREYLPRFFGFGIIPNDNYVLEQFDDLGERGFSVQPGMPYLVIEEMEGERLDHRLERMALEDMNVSAPKILDDFLALAGVLKTFHEAGIYHRDLSEIEIFWTPEGKIKMLDFGLAATQNVPISHSLKSVYKRGYYPNLHPSWLAEDDVRDRVFMAVMLTRHVGATTWRMGQFVQRFELEWMSSYFPEGGESSQLTWDYLIRKITEFSEDIMPRTEKPGDSTRSEIRSLPFGRDTDKRFGTGRFENRQESRPPSKMAGPPLAEMFAVPDQKDQVRSGLHVEDIIPVVVGLETEPGKVLEVSASVEKGIEIFKGVESFGKRLVEVFDDLAVTYAMAQAVRGSPEEAYGYLESLLKKEDLSPEVFDARARQIFESSLESLARQIESNQISRMAPVIFYHPDMRDLLVRFIERTYDAFQMRGDIGAGDFGFHLISHDKAALMDFLLALKTETRRTVKTYAVDQTPGSSEVLYQDLARHVFRNPRFQDHYAVFFPEEDVPVFDTVAPERFVRSDVPLHYAAALIPKLTQYFAMTATSEINAITLQQSIPDVAGGVVYRPGQGMHILTAFLDLVVLVEETFATSA
ncbi:MAG: hypothetical protein JW893_02255, partial [Candidatus Omnitrophica bacterium]|nr:hypothetical protein [Candidatus Omnitrophota bacterium]